MIRQGERLPIAAGYKGQGRPKTTGELISYHRAKSTPAARKTALAWINSKLTIATMVVTIGLAMWFYV